ncbi:hypothetical protein ACVWZ3_001681 [Bradyrhizobium sp. i1.3.6]
MLAGSFHFEAELIRNSCGTLLLLRYFAIAEFGAVPMVAKMKATPSPSTKRRAASMVFGGEKASSSDNRLSLRPLTPPFSLTSSK